MELMSSQGYHYQHHLSRLTLLGLCYTVLVKSLHLYLQQQQKKFAAVKSVSKNTQVYDFARGLLVQSHSWEPCRCKLWQFFVHILDYRLNLTGFSLCCCCNNAKALEK